MDINSKILNAELIKKISPINIKMDKYLKPNYTAKLEKEYSKKSQVIKVNPKKKNKKTKKRKKK